MFVYRLQVAENIEINALIKILGLQYKKKYETEEDFKSLRYGKVMVMADQVSGEPKRGPLRSLQGSECFYASKPFRIKTGLTSKAL